MNEKLLKKELDPNVNYIKCTVPDVKSDDDNGNIIKIDTVVKFIEIENTGTYTCLVKDAVHCRDFEVGKVYSITLEQPIFNCNMEFIKIEQRVKDMWLLHKQSSYNTYRSQCDITYVFSTKWDKNLVEIIVARDEHEQEVNVVNRLSNKVQDGLRDLKSNISDIKDEFRYLNDITRNNGIAIGTALKSIEEKLNK